MNTETLDALILDRALGELPPEATALLEAYLAQNAEAAARAVKLNDTLGAARASLAVLRETPRPLDLAALHREHRSAKRTKKSAQLFKLAACLAIGAAAGWMLRPVPKKEQIVVRTPVVLVSPPHTPEPVSKFWSLERFAPEAAQKSQGKKL